MVVEDHVCQIFYGKEKLDFAKTRMIDLEGEVKNLSSGIADDVK